MLRRLEITASGISEFQKKEVNMHEFKNTACQMMDILQNEISKARAKCQERQQQLDDIEDAFEALKAAISKLNTEKTEKEK